MTGPLRQFNSSKTVKNIKCIKNKMITVDAILFFPDNKTSNMHSKKRKTPNFVSNFVNSIKSE